MNEGAIVNTIVSWASTHSRVSTAFHGDNVAASMQTYAIYIPGKRPCGPKSQGMFKRPWAFTWDTMVIHKEGKQCKNGTFVQ
jgi:hypothetical protein